MTAIGAVGRPFAFLGRMVLWAAVGLVLVRGILDIAAPEDTPTTESRAAEPTSGEPAFDVVRAQAFAVRFASEFASFDPANPDRRRQALESYLAENLDVDLLWQGQELVRPMAVLPMSTEDYGGGQATVTVAVQLAPSRWANLAVPLAGDGERFVVTDLPALVPAAAPAEGVEATARVLDEGLAEELRPTLDAFFRAYGAQDQAALDRYALPGRTLTVLEGGFALDSVLSVDVAAPGDDPDHRRAWVTVRWATPTQGATFASAYELDLVRQDARWYVDGVGASRGLTDLRKEPFMDGAALSNAIRVFVGNIFLALAAVGSLTFLARREFIRLAEFAAATVVIATFVYTPEMYQAIAEFLAGLVTG